MRRASEGEAHPVFLRQAAFELAPDSRRAAESRRLLRRALRLEPTDGSALHSLASHLWDDGDRANALALFRLAACVEDKHEGLAASYFSASRHLREEGVALGLLEGRYRRFGKKSGLPARTYVEALDALGRTEEAFQVVQEAVRQRLGDGELLLFAGSFCSSHGRLSHAERCVAAAEGKVPTAAVLHARASLAIRQGEPEKALVALKAVVASDPLSLPAQGEIAHLLLQTQGRPAAVRHLRAASERFPKHLGLLKLELELLSDDDPRAQQAVLDRLVALDPDDAWTRRERGLLLARRGRIDDALAEAKVALEQDPRNPAGWFLRGRVSLLRGAIREAQEMFRSALRLAVDYTPAADALLDTCANIAERREALTFLKEQLERQVSFGDGVLALGILAQGAFEPPELIRTMREVHARRPDLWQAWTALARHLVDARQLDEALSLSEAAVQRFPLQPQVRLGVASVHEAAGRGEAERQALRDALDLEPDLAQAARRLAASWEREGSLQEARVAAENALRRSPLDPVTLGVLARILWKLGERSAALDALKRAVLLEPGYGWGWETLRGYGVETKQPELAPRLARDVAARRSGDPDAWMVLARMLVAPHERDEQLVALDTALSLNAGLAEAWEMKAAALAEAGRFKEALAACVPVAFEGNRPTELRGREAWILARMGSLEKAVAAMNELLAKEPRYVWGWRNVADWSRAAGDDSGFLLASQKLVELAPDDARSLALRAEALLRVSRKLEARTDLVRVLELDPEDSWAAHTLIDLQLEARDTKAAAATLAKLEKVQPGPEIAARRAQLAAKDGDRGGAQKALSTLARDPKSERWLLELAVSAMKDADMVREIDRALESALGQTVVNAHVGGLWVEAIASTATIGELEERLVGLRKKGRVAFEGTAAYLRVLLHNDHVDQLRQYLRRESTFLREDTVTWAVAGEVFLALGEEKTVCRWMSDWTERSRVEAWMLLHLAVALRRCGDDAEAARVSRRAVRLPEDGSTPLHKLWLTLDALLQGDRAAHPQEDDPLAALDRQRLGPLHGFVFDVVETLLARGRRLRETADEASRRSLMEAAARQLRGAGGPDLPEVPCVTRIRKAALAAASGDSRQKTGLLARLSARLGPS